MRTIKFRAWNKKSEKWEESFGISNDGIFMRLGIGQKSDGIEIMQFTGITDRNGKEIYEGDIVKHCNTKEYNNLHQQKQLFEVVWVKKNFSKDICDGRDDIFMETGFKFKKLFDGLSTVFCPEKDLEVIGNIYESSYLLDNTDTKV